MKARVRTAAVIVVLGLAVLGVVLSGIFPVNTGDAVSDRLVNAVVPRACLAVGLGVLAVVCYKKMFAFPRVTKSALMFFLPCLLIPVANFPFSALISGAAAVNRLDLLWLFIIKCLLIGFVEEILFRGIVIDFIEETLKAKKHRVLLTVLISAAVFGLFHIINLLDGAAPAAVLLQAGYSFLIGCMLGAVYLKTRNIWGCILLHALFDIGGLMISDIGAGSPQDTLFWVLTAVCGVIVTVHVTYAVLTADKQNVN